MYFLLINGALTWNFINISWRVLFPFAVAKIPTGLIDSIKMHYPRVMLRLLNLLGQKLQQSWKRRDTDPLAVVSPSTEPALHVLSGNSSFTTVAVFALSSNIPKLVWIFFHVLLLWITTFFNLKVSIFIGASKCFSTHRTCT